MAKFYLPMEFSVFVMISVAVFLACGESLQLKHGNRSNPFHAGITSTGPSESSKEDSLSKSDKKLSHRFQPAITDIEHVYTKYDSEGKEPSFPKRMNSKKQYSRKFKYDPALALMGLGKRSKYDPALKYMGLGKRVPQYDPALRYMGLGKRVPQYDPALRYMGLGKRVPQYDPALRYMGLGKRAHQYDPALKYMGLGKRTTDYHSPLEYDKRISQYDPALKYMGLGKREFQYDPAIKYMGLGKRGNSYDPGLMYMGLGKRDALYDPGLKYMGLGKRDSAYDDIPDDSYYDPDSEPIDYEFLDDSTGETMSITELQKRKEKYDPALAYMGLGKRKMPYSPFFKYVSINESSTDGDTSAPYVEAYSIDSGAGTANGNSRAIDRPNVSKYLPNSDLEFQKRGLRYNARLPNRFLNREYIADKFENIPGLGKRPYKFDPALRLMGLGKRNGETESDTIDEQDAIYLKPSLSNLKQNKSFADKSDIQNKKQNFWSGLSYEKRSADQNDPQHIKKKYTPDVTYMGVDTLTNEHDPTLLFMGLGKDKQIYDGRMYYRATDEDDGTKNDDSLKYRLDSPDVDSRSKIDVEVFELAKHPNKTDYCGDKCLKRKKREIKSNPEIETEDFVAGKGIYELISPKKRERDNRPRYNPGWIFIGLGKRNYASDDKVKDTKTDTAHYNVKYNVSLDDYFVLLDKIKENLENIESNLEERRHGYKNKPENVFRKVVYPKSYLMMDSSGYWFDEGDFPYASDGTPPNTWQKIVSDPREK